MRSSTSSSSHARSTWSVPFRPREDGAWTTTGRRRLDGGAGATAFRSMPGGITVASGTQRIASKLPTISAPAFFPYASSSGVLPRMSEPR